MRKSKEKIKSIIVFAVFMVISMCFGVLLGKIMLENQEDPSAFSFFMILLWLAISYFLHVIVHEAGHLICGLLSGYQFLSFRIGSFVIQKVNNQFQIKKMSLAGTAGQCLMNPPEKHGENYPVGLYFTGGILANVLLSVVCLLISEYSVHFSLYLRILAFLGIAMAVINGIPVKTPLIVNDGYNILNLRKNKIARESLWRQLKINYMQTNGIRLKDMPSEWFELPEDADYHDISISTIAVFKENRLMDEHDFDGAKDMIRFLISDSCKVIGLYKIMLQLDQTYIDLLERGEQADVKVLSQKETAGVIKQMKDFPAIIRTQYAAAVKKQNLTEQQKLLERFEKVKKTYPIQADLASEAELIRLIETR